MAIAVGSAAIDRSTYDSNYTVIDGNLAATGTGTINHIEVYGYQAGTIEVASFQQVNTDTFTSRASSGSLTITTGLNTFNAPADFTAFDIVAGDYIGYFGATGQGAVDRAISGGTNCWRKSGDQIPCTAVLFTSLAAGILSLYATGTEAGGIEWLAGISVGVATISGLTKLLRKVGGISLGIGTVSGITKVLKKIVGTSVGGQPDVGAPAIDRTGLLNGPYTFIFKNNPAKSSGLIGHIEIYMNAGGYIVEIASFHNISGNNFSTVGSSGSLSVVTGLNVFNAPADFSAFPIGAGDYIGIYLPDLNCKVERDDNGPGYWWKGGDYIPCTNQTFTSLSIARVSLYAKIVSVSGLIKLFKAIKGTSSGIATISGNIIVGLFLTGIANGIAAITGVVKITKSIKAMVFGIATVLGSFWEGWTKRQKSAMTFQMKEKPSTQFEKKEKPSMTFQKKEKASTSWTKKEKSSSSWSKK